MFCDDESTKNMCGTGEGEDNSAADGLDETHNGNEDRAETTQGR